MKLNQAESDARMEMMEQVTKVVFLLNIAKVGDYSCALASLLVAVDIPEGITSIGQESFAGCSSLKDIKFPKSLTSIGIQSFNSCSSLEKVDLLHTNVEYLGQQAFQGCTSLREMKIPDSLQTFGSRVFENCSKLVPSTIDITNTNGYDDDEDDVDVIREYSDMITSEVVAFLRSIQ